MLRRGFESFPRIGTYSPEGYTVKITPIEKTFTIDDKKRAHARYQAEFYKPGQSKPFETVTGDQSFSVFDSPFESHTPYARLDISFG